VSDPSIVKAQQRVYRESFREHGDSPHATKNGGRENQQLRFERLLRQLPTDAPFTVHDVGAGLCDLHGWLLDQGLEHGYSATEIVPEMIALAREKFPEIEIRDRDLLAATPSGEPSERHDFVVLSGVFNVPGEVPAEDWHRFVLDMIARMYELCGVAVAFNFLDARRTFTDPSLFYIDAGELVDHCVRRHSRFVVLDRCYPLFECTLTIFRPEYVRKLHPGGHNDKYFGVTRFGG
jgi:hypothetical protein